MSINCKNCQGEVIETGKMPFNDYVRNSAASIASKKQPIAITAEDKAKVKKRRALEERLLMRELGVEDLFVERKV